MSVNEIKFVYGADFLKWHVACGLYRSRFESSLFIVSLWTFWPKSKRLLFCLAPPSLFFFGSFHQLCCCEWKAKHREGSSLGVNRESHLCVYLFFIFRDATWIDACNTSDHSCNIFPTMYSPSDPLWARVKARLGQQESAYAESKEFILCQQGE